MLKTKVKASSVTNLTDARYFAAWEAEWLGFNLDAGSESYVAPQVMQAIKEWVDGVKIVGEFSLQSAEEVLQAADLLELEAVQLGMYTPDAALKALHQEEVPVLLEIVLESIDGLSDVVQQMEEKAPFVHAFLLNFDKNGIAWEQMDLSTKEKLKEICLRHPLILSMGFKPDSLDEVLALQPYGISVQGGEEEKVGFKSFDELDELFEQLETFE